MPDDPPDDDGKVDFVEKERAPLGVRKLGQLREQLFNYGETMAGMAHRFGVESDVGVAQGGASLDETNIARAAWDDGLPQDTPLQKFGAIPDEGAPDYTDTGAFTWVTNNLGPDDNGKIGKQDWAEYLSDSYMSWQIWAVKVGLMLARLTSFGQHGGRK